MCIRDSLTAETFGPLTLFLRVSILSRVLWHTRSLSAFNKANKMLELVKRTIKQRNMDMMIQLYKSLVRPHLEYCSPAWSPHYVKDKALVEKVQHRFTRRFPDLRKMKHEARLRLWSLEERRNGADLIEVYKMVHWLSSVPVTAFFRLATNSCTRGHSRKLVKAQCRTDIRLHFSSRVLNRRNSLLQDTVDACSVNVCLQTASRQDFTQQDGFLYGLGVRITLLAAARARVW